MTPLPEFERRPATALVAMANALSMGDPVSEDALTQVIRAVSTSSSERAALLAAIGAANDPETGLTVADLLTAFATRAGDAEAQAQDADQVIGQWSQRLAAGALLASFGAAIAGTVTGGLAFGLTLLSFSGFIFATASRLGGRARRRIKTQEREAAETLARHVLEAAKNTGSAK
ncbi:hypothetical protein J4729_20640 [Leisingera sp. HS039]|uniref:hypothetical protein n=1 Tax=unclassified Leisingera TaxID=2614906 RepID=UPI0010710789|nr:MULTISPECIES: hypothetical protein [unclassified Leisingera]MBQ4826933.1 hypothetical protein [Leisingera sp. HS039]MCF6429845.1 hypothetical protein [Leisingera sp. MMG026]QBR36754.1 hypothetical protein ETW23_12005 [Leisingera sp. NJS201]